MQLDKSNYSPLAEGVGKKHEAYVIYDKKQGMFTSCDLYHTWYQNAI